MDEIERFELDESFSPPLLQRIAQNYVLRGDPESAYRLLERAVDIGWNDYYWLVNDPAWEETLARPEFRDLMAGVQAEVVRQRAIVEADNSVEEFRAEFENGDDVAWN